MWEVPEALHLSNIETTEDTVMLFTTDIVKIAWSLPLHSRIETEIYKRDELICAVTLAGSADSGVHLRCVSS